MNYEIPSNDDFAERLKKLNRKTEVEQRKFYSGDWYDIPFNEIINDLVNDRVGVYEDLLNDIKTAIERYGAPADDPDTIETMREIQILLKYIEK